MQASVHRRPARIGVILPSRNRLRTLPAALNSVLEQTWRDLEVMVVDDASTDGTADYLAGLSDPRVRHRRLDRPRGAGGARNAGLEMMHNEWIAFQDSDDRWLPDKLEKQMAAVESASVEPGFVYCRCRRVSASSSYVFPPLHVRRLSGRIYETLLGGNLVSTQTAMIRRACMDEHGLFDETLPPLEDWELFLRLSRNVEAVFVDEILVESSLRKDSISQRNNDVISAFLAILERYEDDYAMHPRLRARHLGTIADRLCMAGRMEEGKARYAEAIRLRPFHLGRAAGWALAGMPFAYKAMRTWRQKISLV